MSHKTRIVFIQTSLGHYHYPRMQHLALRCQQEGLEFQNIELSSYVQDYPWVVDKNQRGFENCTLFPGQTLEQLPQAAVWKALEEALRQALPDVLFILGYSMDVMRRATLWAKRANIATVIISDSNAFDKKRYFPLEFYKSTWVSRFDAAFTAGKTSSLYIEKLGIPRSRIACGCDVIDTGLFQERSDQNRLHPDEVRSKIGLEEPYFLFVARLIPEKNLPRLLLAYRNYAARFDHPLKLVICGSGPQAETIHKTIESFPAPIKDRIRCKGYIAQPEVIDYFTFAQCFILPSTYEPWGLVINEALACGIPVLVSNRAGSSYDLVQDGIIGWTFDPYRTEEMTTLLVKMHGMDEKQRKLLGIIGREIMACWGLEKFTTGVIEAAQLALEHHRKSRKVSE